jgi:hypothetical protein
MSGEGLEISTDIGAEILLFDMAWFLASRC